MIECFPLIVLSERIERVVRSRKHTGVCNHNLLPILSYLSASEGFVNSRCRNTQGIGDLRLCIAGGQHCFSTGMLCARHQGCCTRGSKLSNAVHVSVSHHLLEHVGTDGPTLDRLPFLVG